jgi:hypothetical protein
MCGKRASLVPLPLALRTLASLIVTPGPCRQVLQPLITRTLHRNQTEAIRLRPETLNPKPETLVQPHAPNLEPYQMRLDICARYQTYVLAIT